jgi:hypothetical protein
MRNFTSLIGLSASVAVAAGDSAAPGIQCSFNRGKRHNNFGI